MVLRRFLLFALFVIPLAVALWGYLAIYGYLGELQGMGEITQQRRDPGVQRAEKRRQQESIAKLPVADPGVMSEKQILFGDLHVHTTYSFDAYNISLPMYQGEGSHPPGDACDFARYCSGLDFWSINDHAEALTAAQWSLTKDAVRQCNAVSGDPANPDMVTFLGWEWTQTARVPENHYGHKNVIFRDTDDSDVPTRPIAASKITHPEGVASHIAKVRLLLIAGVADGNLRLLFDNVLRWFRGEDVQLLPAAKARQRYYDFNRYLRDQDALAACPKGPHVRELPTQCQESAATPSELFAKLDDWGFPHLTIPHGNSWGAYTPPLTSWDKQLMGKDPEHQEPLIEIFSGHGNAEQYRPWRAVAVDENGHNYCPAPTVDFLPMCWRAGEIIRERCLEVGESAEECERRAAQTRAQFILTKGSGHWIVPGSTVEDWLDAGECRDCYMAPYEHRPTGSVQYGLAIRNFDDPSRPPKRFRWGIIGSSDSHSARAGAGYKELMRLKMTDANVAQLGPRAFSIAGERLPHYVALHKSDERGGAYFERQASFYGTGGLVAVHAQGRDRQAIWDALERKEVYATSGDRILLWFDLVNPLDGQKLPMGSIVQRNTTPEFEVSALGAFEQKPGCPADSARALSKDRLQRLCGGECYNPGDRRKRIDRIEVVKIRPQIVSGEEVGSLIEDPWRVLSCKGDGEGCTVRFSDPDFMSSHRDAVYYVRALEEASPTINAANLRCEYDAAGQCIKVNPCSVIAPTDATDDCLANAQERAWSSPIFVDFAQSGNK